MVTGLLSLRGWICEGHGFLRILVRHRRAAAVSFDAAVSVRFRRAVSHLAGIPALPFGLQHALYQRRRYSVLPGKIQQQDEALNGCWKKFDGNLILGSASLHLFHYMFHI